MACAPTTCAACAVSAWMTARFRSASGIGAGWPSSRGRMAKASQVGLPGANWTSCPATADPPGRRGYRGPTKPPACWLRNGKTGTSARWRVTTKLPRPTQNSAIYSADRGHRPQRKALQIRSHPRTIRFQTKALGWCSFLDTEGVRGSNPLSRTILTRLD